MYTSTPTWPNHPNIIENAGLNKIVSYPYYDPKTRGSDIKGMIKCLEGAVPGSVVLLHACAHNPTGVDPTQEQWGKIADVCEVTSNLSLSFAV